MPCKKLTLKQKEYAKESVATRNSTEAAMRVYHCKSRAVAANMAYHLNQNPKVRAELERLLVDANISEEKVMQRVAEGLEANRVVVLKDTGEVYQSDVPDLYARHKYVETAARLLEMNPSTKIETRNINVDLELDKMTPKQLEAFAKAFFDTLNGHKDTPKLTDFVGAPEGSEEKPS